MKKSLSEFYTFEKEYFNHLWNEAIIIPDANILLNLYYYSRKTSQELIAILSKFSERLWIPYQVAFEYQKNRLNKIRAQKESYNNLKKSIQSVIDSINKELNDKYSKHPFLEVSKIKIILDESFKDIEKYLNDARDNHPDWEKNDEIRNDLDKLFENKVGVPYSRNKLKEIYEIGYFRYENKIPPGYTDDKKEKEKKYGDLIIWLDIIEKAKKEKKSIVFINDEKKEDWWQKDNNNLMPSYELIGEMKNEANVSFYMYNAEDFIKNSYKFLKQIPKTSVIKELRTFSIFSNVLENLRLQNEALLTSIKPVTIPNANIEALKAALIGFNIPNTNIEALKDFNIPNTNIEALKAALIGFKSISDQIPKSTSRVSESSTGKSQELTKNNINIKTNNPVKYNDNNKIINKNSNKKLKENKEEA